MTVELIAALGRDAVTTVLMVAAPLLGAALVLGLVIGVFQAVTSIQEQTLTFIPKVLGVLVVLLLCLPWMIRVLTSYTANLFVHLSRFGAS